MGNAVRRFNPIRLKVFRVPALAMVGLLLSALCSGAQTWKLTSAPSNNWISVCASADGARIWAAARSGGIYRSTNSGRNWLPTSAPTGNWAAVVSSAEGSQVVAADGKNHVVEFTIPIARSSWIALREFPQLHTNPVNVLISGKPIRASRQSALWAIACIDQLWRVRHLAISEAERGDAAKAYEEAREIYRRIAEESTDDL